MKKLFILIFLLAPLAAISGDVLQAVIKVTRAFDRITILMEQIQPKQQKPQSLKTLVREMIKDLPQK